VVSNAISRVRPFPLKLFNQLTFDLDIFQVYGPYIIVLRGLKVSV